MPVASPPPSTRPLEGPDWARWEAELAAREPLDPGGSGPADPPEPPGEEPGDRPGDDPRRPQRSDLTWLRVLFGALALLVVVTFATTSAGQRQLPPGATPAPPAKTKAEAAQRAGATIDRMQVMMNVPPPRTEPSR